MILLMQLQTSAFFFVSFGGILISDGDVNVLLMFGNKAQLWTDHPRSKETFMTVNFHTL